MWDTLVKARDDNRVRFATLPQASVGGYNFQVTYKIDGRLLQEMSDAELEQVGLGIWLDYQNRYELWQTTDTPFGFSTYHPEDIPSTYLAYVDAVRDDLDYEDIVDLMGGGTPAFFGPENFPEFENKTQYFIYPANNTNGFSINFYPSELLILPVQNLGFWSVMG